jgi:hypothetical protein
VLQKGTQRPSSPAKSLLFEDIKIVSILTLAVRTPSSVLRQIGDSLALMLSGPSDMRSSAAPCPECNTPEEITLQHG